MSKLAKKLEKACEERLKETRRAVEDANDKMLVLDIERMKGSASIEFWDLGDYKNRRISPDDVTEWPRTICGAWTWVGSRKTEFASEWGDGREKMLVRMWEAFDRAEYVIGHNVANFDAKKLNSEWRDIGLPPPSPYRVIDTLKIARANFGDESKTLDSLTKRLGLSSKTDKYDVDVARAALAGDKKAQRKIQSYNEGDIQASLELYLALVPWIKGLGHIKSDATEEDVCCPRCASEDVTAKEEPHSVGIYRYLKYVCNTCGGYFKGAYHSRGPAIRPL